MRRSVYFHIDEVARDAVVAANLRRILHAQGVELVYGNRGHSPLFGLFDNFAAFDLYVFPSLDIFRDNCPVPDRLFAPVIILPSETIGGTTRNVERLAAKYIGSFPKECRPWTEKVAAFCVWGFSHLKCFEALAPEFLPKCHVVGNPRFDKRCQLPTPDSYRDERIRVGLISRFVGINRYYRGTMLEFVYAARKVPGRMHPVYRMSPARDIEDRIYTEAVDLRLLFQLIDSLDPKRCDLVVRIHPREDRIGWEDLIRTNRLPVRIAPWDEPYLHWVNSVDYVVGPVSTSFYDCIIAGKMPICTVDITPHRQAHILVGSDDENPILNYVIRPRSIEELVAIVSTRPREGFELPVTLREILHQEANYPDCFSSLDSVARVFLNVLDAIKSGQRARWSARLKHEVLGAAHTMYCHLRGRGRAEQSVSFVLGPKRRRWIDKLAFAK